METALLVENISKRYGAREVVKGISFAVKPAEIFGFLGPNGAGKTTSIRMMIGELPRDGGRVEIMGYRMPEDREKVIEIMGVVPDHQNLYDRLTVRQNLDLFSRLFGIPPKRIDEVIDLVGLKEHADVPTQNLSRGLRQRTLIGRGILHQPKIFFLDEPTSALDPHSAMAIRELIQRLKAQGTTVLLTTHYMEEANSLCDRLAILHQGVLVATDTPEQLRLRYGRPVLKVTLKPSGNEEPPLLELPMNDKQGAATLNDLLAAGKVLRLHSQEATLEEVFLNLTGNAWKAPEGEAE